MCCGEQGAGSKEEGAGCREWGVGSGEWDASRGIKEFYTLRSQTVTTSQWVDGVTKALASSVADLPRVNPRLGQTDCR